jgi:hypothetical protein
VIAGDIGNGVGFVENDALIIWEQVDAQSPERKVGEEERVIDDEDIGVLKSLPCFEVMTVTVAWTFSS